jgi:hypothetical protein
MKTIMLVVGVVVFAVGCGGSVDANVGTNNSALQTDSGQPDSGQANNDCDDNDPKRHHKTDRDGNDHDRDNRNDAGSKRDSSDNDDNDDVDAGTNADANDPPVQHSCNAASDCETPKGSIAVCVANLCVIQQQCVCLNGTNSNGQAVAGNCGDVICGVNHNPVVCTNGVWTPFAPSFCQ